MSEGDAASIVSSSPPQATRVISGVSGGGGESESADSLRATRLFERWQKTFLGAIDKQSEEYVIGMLREGEALLASGALSLNRSIKPASGSTFLHTVAWFQKGRVIEWLLQHGADPNQGNLKGNTPFHLLCENANKDIAPQLIQIMINYGASITQPDATGQDAVAKAKAVGFDVTQLDFSKGQSFLARRAAGMSALEAAAAANASATATAGTAQADNEEKTDELPPLTEPERVVAEQKASLVYRKLSTLFLGLDAANSSQAVDDAIIRILSSNLHLVHHKLLRLSEPPADAAGRTFLHLAVNARRVEIVRALIRGQADPNQQDDAGDTPLHLAMARVTEENGGAIVAALLDAGASKTIPNYLRGHTPPQMMPPTTSVELRAWVDSYVPQLKGKLGSQAVAKLFGVGGSTGSGAAPLPAGSGGASGPVVAAANVGGLSIGSTAGAEKQDRAGARALMARLANAVNAGSGLASGAGGDLLSPKGAASLLKRASMSGGSISAASNSAPGVPRRASATGPVGGALFAGIGLNPAGPGSGPLPDGPAGGRGALASILSKHGVGGGGVAGPGGAPAGTAAPAKPGLTSNVLRGGATTPAAVGRRSSATCPVGAGAHVSESALHVDELFSLLDLSESHTLPLAQVNALHGAMHGCGGASGGVSGCPVWLVQQVLDSSIPAGLCTRANVLEVLAQLSVLCSAQSQLRYDFQALDFEGLGALPTDSLGFGAGAGYNSAAELVWGVNDTAGATAAASAGGGGRFDDFLARKQRLQTDKRAPPREVKWSEIQAELIGKPVTLG